MITTSTETSQYIDYGPNKPGMILQREEKHEWIDYLVDGRPVVSPIKEDTLPPGRYRLRMQGSYPS